MDGRVLDVKYNRWKVASNGVRTDVIDDGDDVVEVMLGDSIDENDVEGDYFFAKNQIITI